MKFCKLCHLNDAELPDRNNVSKRKQICKMCHAKRLAEDLARIYGTARSMVNEELKS